jgi:hypothetical protein
MKKLSYLFLALIIGFMTSCGVTPEVQPVTEDFSLPAADGTLDLSFTDAKLNVTNPTVNAANGDNVNVSLLIKKTPTSDKPRVIRVFVADLPNYRKSTQPLFEIKLKNIDEQTQTVDFTVSKNSGEYYLHFDVYDNKEKVTRKTLKINVTADGQIATWTGITLGAQSNALGSRVASATGDVYAVCDLDSNIRYVDITYAADRVTAKPSFFSNPERGRVGFSTTVPASNTACGGTSTGGGTATYFVLAPTTVDFATVTDAQLGALTIPTTAQSIVAETGKIYAFLNGRQKKGLIKVNSITGAADGTINFDIKVQK